MRSRRDLFQGEREQPPYQASLRLVIFQKIMVSHPGTTVHIMLEGLLDTLLRQGQVAQHFLAPSQQQTIALLLSDRARLPPGGLRLLVSSQVGKRLHQVAEAGHQLIAILQVTRMLTGALPVRERLLPVSLLRRDSPLVVLAVDEDLLIEA